MPAASWLAARRSRPTVGASRLTVAPSSFTIPKSRPATAASRKGIATSRPGTAASFVSTPASRLPPVPDAPPVFAPPFPLAPPDVAVPPEALPPFEEPPVPEENIDEPPSPPALVAPPLPDKAESALLSGISPPVGMQLRIESNTAPNEAFANVKQHLFLVWANMAIVNRGRKTPTSQPESPGRTCLATVAPPQYAKRYWQQATIVLPTVLPVQSTA